MIRETNEGWHPPARICMPTWRHFENRAFRCGLYEAQDVLSDIDDVDLIHLDMSWGARVPESWLRLPLFHDVSGKLVFANPGLKKVRLRHGYDVFIAVCNTHWDLPYINAIDHWRDRCKVSICWLDELWAANVPGYKRFLHSLTRFDYVFTGCRGTVSALSKLMGRPCYWLPGGIDALRFAPYPQEPARVIDVYSIGRRHDALHQQFRSAADRGAFFYLHDTIANFANRPVQDHRQHRDLLANIAKRSRYFVVAPAKVDATYETRGQIEIGYRYFEGAASGAVMIGDVPDCEAYSELFGWPEAVVPIRPDGTDVMAVLAELDSDPGRLSRLSRRNARETLLRHDWVYRWEEMFRIAGVNLSPGAAARKQGLKDLARLTEISAEPVGE